MKQKKDFLLCSLLCSVFLLLLLDGLSGVSRIWFVTTLEIYPTYPFIFLSFFLYFGSLHWFQWLQKFVTEISIFSHYFSDTLLETMKKFIYFYLIDKSSNSSKNWYKKKQHSCEAIKSTIAIKGIWREWKSWLTQQCISCFPIYFQDPPLKLYNIINLSSTSVLVYWMISPHTDNNIPRNFSITLISINLQWHFQNSVKSLLASIVSTIFCILLKHTSEFLYL